MDEPLGPPKEAERVALAQLARNSAFELILTYWPGDTDGPRRHRLATAHPHGRWVRWEG